MGRGEDCTLEVRASTSVASLLLFQTVSSDGPEERVGRLRWKVTGSSLILSQMCLRKGVELEGEGESEAGRERKRREGEVEKDVTHLPLRQIF